MVLERQRVTEGLYVMGQRISKFMRLQIEKMDKKYLYRGEWINPTPKSVKWAFGILDIIESEGEKITVANIKGDGYQYGVVPKSIGRCTGIKDKNGVLIFEGDFINYFGLYKTETWYEITGIEKDSEILKDREYITVVGNIHDNPEMLEGFMI